MLGKINFKILFATALSFALINSVEFPKPSSHSGTWLKISNEAFAKSSGGRSGGGSFSRPSNSGGSSSGGSRSSGSNSDSNSSGSSNRSYDSDYRSNPGYGSGGSSVIVVPGSGGYYGGGGGYYRSGGILPLLLLIVVPTSLIALLVFTFWKQMAPASSYGSEPMTLDGSTSQSNERDNNIVTISKLQVALFSQTKGFQSELSKLTLSVDTNTSEGLLELLQESVLVLLRNSENWSHVLASSQSTSVEKAEPIFNQFSMQERSKFSAETLTNIKGKVKHKEAVIPGLEEDPAAYIVVTLLVGTADDKPLFKEIRSAEALKEALKKVASVPSDYLMTFELLWSPQVEEDSLTYDELLTEYTDMVQIA